MDGRGPVPPPPPQKKNREREKERHWNAHALVSESTNLDLGTRVDEPPQDVYDDKLPLLLGNNFVGEHEVADDANRELPARKGTRRTAWIGAKMRQRSLRHTVAVGRKLLPSGIENSTSMYISRRTTTRWRRSLLEGYTLKHVGRIAELPRSTQASASLSVRSSFEKRSLTLLTVLTTAYVVAEVAETHHSAAKFSKNPAAPATSHQRSN